MNMSLAADIAVASLVVIVAMVIWWAIASANDQ